MAAAGIENTESSLEPFTAVEPEALWHQLRSDWLMVGASSESSSGTSSQPAKLSYKSAGEVWFAQVKDRHAQLVQQATIAKTVPTPSRTVLIAERSPADFLASFWAALLAGWNIALANPSWGLQEWASAAHTLAFDVIWAGPDCPLHTLQSQARSQSFPVLHKAILIPTGGSSGHIKFAHHRWSSLRAATMGFCQHFGVNVPVDAYPVDAYCVLPLYHVSGLMQALRTIISGGQLFLTPFKPLLSSRLSPTAERDLAPDRFISLVPTQLERLLRAERASWLRQFRAVLLGGAPPWPSLLSQAAAEQLPLCLSYGMTETAAMVTSTRPGDFIESSDHLDAFGSGLVMPHAGIEIHDSGRSLLPANEIGQIVVRSSAIAQGYLTSVAPPLSSSFALSTFYTDDLGYLDDTGCLHITGRASRKIISGGENIFPDEVESALRSTEQVKDVCVLGLSDSEWGEVVVAVYVPMHETVLPESLKAALTNANCQGPQLSHYKHPKRWFPVTQLPRNAQGKLNYTAILNLIETLSTQ